VKGVHCITKGALILFKKNHGSFLPGTPRWGDDARIFNLTFQKEFCTKGK
jgi:hypothetical protein